MPWLRLYGRHLGKMQVHSDNNEGLMFSWWPNGSLYRAGKGLVQVTIYKFGIAIIGKRRKGHNQLASLAFLGITPRSQYPVRTDMIGNIQNRKEAAWGRI
jgi:hypothetical protein